MNLSPYIPLCEAMVLLMKPVVEVVIHDLQTNTIAFIKGGLSHRVAGDPSLSDINLEENIDKKVYKKLNFDGRLIKSISIPLKEDGRIKALLCINCDVSVFSQMHNLAAQFLGHIQPRPESLFKDDWQERIHLAIHTYLDENEWSFEALNTAKKKAVVKHLFGSGAFSEKNAADYIANVLSMGRATIFKYLKEWKQNQ